MGKYSQSLVKSRAVDWLTQLLDCTFNLFSIFHWLWTSEARFFTCFLPFFQFLCVRIADEQSTCSTSRSVNGRQCATEKLKSSEMFSRFPENFSDSRSLFSLAVCVCAQDYEWRSRYFSRSALAVSQSLVISAVELMARSMRWLLRCLWCLWAGDFWRNVLRELFTRGKAVSWCWWDLFCFHSNVLL